MKLRLRGDIYENLMMALGTLRAHKLRSALTVVGVIIGVWTVMAIASIISGIDEAVKKEIESFGTRSIIISKYEPGIQVGRRSREERMRKDLTFEVAERQHRRRGRSLIVAALATALVGTAVSLAAASAWSAAREDGAEVRFQDAAGKQRDFILMLGTDLAGYDVPNQLVEQIYKDTGVRTSPLRGVGFVVGR